MGATFGVPAILFNQGGQDETEGTTSAAYKAAYKTLIDDVTADIAVAILAQSRLPFWLGTVVDGGAIVTGIIAQAQMELFGCSPATGASTPYSPNMYMIGGSYQMPDHGNHLSQNGYRWLGAMYAKVMNKVMLRGQGWLPLHVIGVWRRGSQVLLDFHVPEPPLQIKPVFVIDELKTFSDCGFTVSDGSGVLTPTSVALVSDTSVLLTFGSAFMGTVVVSYADFSHKGSGNICDSDPAISLDNWIFMAGSGQLLTENFPGPISSTQIVSNGQPYPLWNYACPFNQITAVPT